jgi:hypothetical protein
MNLNRYGATLIQDTADFFYLAGPAFSEVITRADFPIDPFVDSWPAFYTWMFAHQIERVFGLTCDGHKRRAHPNVVIIDQVHNLIDLDTVTKSTLVVPRIYDDQTLEVSLWYDDLVIRYNPTRAMQLGSMRFSGTNSNI